MQSYFDTDFPEELCQGLFLTFIKPDEGSIPKAAASAAGMIQLA